MRDYELVLIINPEVGEAEIKKTIKSVQDLVVSLKGKVKKETDWGKQELAYPIKKLRQASFFLLDLNLPAEGPREIEKKLRLMENIIRYLIVVKSGG